jgi:hypothetical protein
MKKKLAILAATAAMAMVLVTGPASAEDHDLDDELLFRGYPIYGNVVDDLEYDNVSEHSGLDGECFADDVDLDGLVTEREVTCYY